MSRSIASLDARFTDPDARPMQVALAVLAAHSSVDHATLRTAARRSGSPRIAGVASSRSSWSKAVRLSSLYSSAFLLPGAAAESAEARDAVALSVARKLVGHLLAPNPEGLSTRLGPVTRHALAIAGSQELHAARTKGWSSTLLAGPWLAAELGAATPKVGKSAIDRLAQIGWLSKGRRARGAGRASVYRVARLTLAEGAGLFEEYSATVDALVLGKPGVDPLADLILSARAAGWAHGPDAPGSAVWVHALELASGRRLGLSTRTRAAARAWLSSRALDVPGLILWVAGRSRPGTLASLEKGAAEQARSERSAELKALTDEHRERVRAAGEHLRAVALELCKHPGRRSSVAALVPGPEQGPEVAQRWTAMARRALMMRGVDVELAPQIEKQLKVALTTSGHTDRTASVIAEAVVSGIRPRGTDIPQSQAA